MYHDAIGKKGRALAADEKKQLTTGRNETPGDRFGGDVMPPFGSCDHRNGRTPFLFCCHSSTALKE